MTPNYFRWIKISTAAPSNPWPTSLNTGWVSHYNFNTSSYVNTETGDISDAHGSINGTTAAGTIDYTTVSGTLHAAQFGSGDRVEFGATHEYSGSCSFSFWIKNTAAATGNYAVVFGQRPNGSGVRGTRLFEFNNTSDTQVRMQTNDGSWRSDGTLVTLSNQNQWYHVIIVCDESVGTENQQIKGYVYGTLNGTDNLASSSGMATGQSGNTDPFFIGQNTWDSDHWNGQIADLRIWDRALTSSEVEALWDYEKEEQILIVNTIDGDGDGVGLYDDIDDTTSAWGLGTEEAIWIGYRDTSRSDRNWYENVTMNESGSNTQIFSVNPNPWYGDTVHFPGTSMRVPPGTVSKTYYLSSSVDRYNGNMDLYAFSGSASDVINNVKGQSNDDAITAGAVRIWHNPPPGDNKACGLIQIDANGTPVYAQDLDQDGIFSGSGYSPSDVDDDSTSWGADFNGVFVGYSSDHGGRWDSLSLVDSSNTQQWTLNPVNTGGNVNWTAARVLPNSVNSTYYLSASFNSNDSSQGLYWYSGSAAYVVSNLQGQSEATNASLANEIFDWAHNVNKLVQHGNGTGDFFKFTIDAEGNVTTAQDFDQDGIYSGSAAASDDIDDDSTAFTDNWNGVFFGWNNTNGGGGRWNSLSLVDSSNTEIWEFDPWSSSNMTWNTATYHLPRNTVSATYYISCSFDSKSDGQQLMAFSGSAQDVRDDLHSQTPATNLSNGATQIFNYPHNVNDMITNGTGTGAIAKIVVAANGSITITTDSDQDGTFS